MSNNVRSFMPLTTLFGSAMLWGVTAAVIYDTRLVTQINQRKIQDLQARTAHVEQRINQANIPQISREDNLRYAGEQEW